MVNKFRFRITNNKKLLRKVGKQWVTVSAFALALLGGGAVATTTAVHANANINQPKSAVVTDNLNKALQQKSQSSGVTQSGSARSAKPSVSASSGISYSGSASARFSNATPQGIMKTASLVHANMLNNAQKPNTAPSLASAKSSVVSQSASSVLNKASSNNNAINTFTLGTPVQQQRGWNFVQHGVRNNDYDNTKPSATSSSSSVTQSASSSASAGSVAPSSSVSAKPSFNSAYKSYMAQMSGTDSGVASVNGDNTQTDNKNVKRPLIKDSNDVSQYFSGGVTKTGNDLGLNYKVYANGGVEITNGTAQRNLHYFSLNNSDINEAQAITVDNSVDVKNTTDMSQMFTSVTGALKYLNLGNNFDTSNVTNMSDMFYNDRFTTLTLPESFNTKNVTNMNYMFMSDTNLQKLTLPSTFDTRKVQSDSFSMAFEHDNNFTTLVNHSNNINDVISLAINGGRGNPTSFFKKENNHYIPLYSNGQSNTSSDNSPFIMMPAINGLPYRVHGNTIEFLGGSTSGDISNLLSNYDFKNVQQATHVQFDSDVNIHDITGESSVLSTNINSITLSRGVESLLKSLHDNMNHGVMLGNDCPEWFVHAYKKDANDNYTSVTPVNLLDGNNHVGTYQSTMSPNPAFKVQSYGVVYLNQNKTEIGQANLSNLGYVGQTINIEPQLAANVPQGYHLDDTNPINITLNNSGVINVNTSSNVSSTYHGLLGGMLRSTTANTDNHVITVSGNPINYNGNVTLNFKANGKTIKSITKPYSVNTYTGDTVNLLNPASYLDGSNLTDNNNNPITINNTYFTPDSNNNSETVTVQPSDAPQTSGNAKTNNNYVLNYNANSVNDNITYDLSGSNVPNNYQGQTGRLNGTSLNGVYDTNVPLSALNADVPTNYHIVSGNNICYDNGSHTVELAPNSENVNVTYTDQNGHTYVGSVNGQYDQKINDITNNYNLPAGYHVNAGQDNSYTFNGNQNQSKALNITGNTQSGNVTVISKKYDGSTYEGETSKTVHESGDTGNGFTINPTDSQFTPAGYSSQSGQYNGTFTPTGLSTNTVVFNYKAGTGTAISVNYTNQHGANVGSGMITGNTDDKGNISSQVPVPNGYTVNTGQPSQYHILAGAQNPISIKVIGKPVSELNGQGKFTITINKHIGSKVVPSAKVINISGNVGDTFTVTPSNYTPTGYTSTTNPIQSTITPNGLAQSSAAFDYTANTGDPINVTYKNQNGATVGHGAYTGVVDQTGNITSDVKVPSDYTLNGGQNTSFTTTLNDQNMTLNVTGKPANAMINFINQNGNPAGSENVIGKAGDTVSPSQYPKGYEIPTTPTKYVFSKSGQNPDEDNVQLTGKIAGFINGSKNRGAQKNASTGYVTVHVVEKSTNGKLLHQFDTLVSENQKRVGDSYTVEPSDVTPSDYDVASGDNSVNGVINTDGSVSNGNVTDTYTVHASDIEPISITVKNQNGHYIDLSTGKLTDSVDKATSTINNTTLAQLGGVDDAVDITNYINAPKGYHITGNKSAIEDVNGEKLDTITLEHKRAGLGAMPLMLALWTPTPKKPAHHNSGKVTPVKPNKHNHGKVTPIKPNKSTSSGNVAPIQPSSASVAPNSKASSASSSVTPSSTNSIASNASVALASQSIAPVVTPSSKASSVNASAKPSSAVTRHAKSTTPKTVAHHSAIKPVTHHSNKATNHVSRKAMANTKVKHLNHEITKATRELNEIKHHVVTVKAARRATHARLVIKNAENELTLIGKAKHIDAKPATVTRATVNEPTIDKSVATKSDVQATGNNIAPSSIATESVTKPSNAPKSHVATQSTATTYINRKKLPQTGEANVHTGATALIVMAAGAIIAGFGKVFDRKHNK